MDSAAPLKGSGNLTSNGIYTVRVVAITWHLLYKSAPTILEKQPLAVLFLDKILFLYEVLIKAQKAAGQLYNRPIYPINYTKVSGTSI